MNAGREEVQNKLNKIKQRQQLIRDLRRWRRFIAWNIVQPVSLGTMGCLLMTWLAFKDLRMPSLVDWHLVYQGISHAIALTLIVLAFWGPYLTLIKFGRKTQFAIFFLRNVFLTAVLVLFFPYQLLHMLMKGFKGENIIWLAVIASIIAFVFAMFYSSFFIARPDRKWRRLIEGNNHKMLKAKPHKLSQAAMYLFFVYIFLLVESWFTAALLTKDKHPFNYLLEGPKLVWGQLIRNDEPDRFFALIPPYRILFEKNLLDLEIYSSEGELANPIKRNNWAYPPKNSKRRTRLEANLLAWACIALVNTFLILAFGGFSSRILTAVLPVATQQPERIYKHIKEIIMKADIYTKNFRDYLANEYAFSVLGGFFGTIIYLGIPIVLHAAGQYETLANAFNEDTAFFAAALMAAWLGPILVALYRIDDTFGKHFNAAIADHLMDIKDHVVYVGYGDIGKRIVDRNVRRAYIFGREENIKELVTPDLLVVRVFMATIVLDTSDQDFIYAAENDLLGRYGVVAVENVGGMRLSKIKSWESIYNFVMEKRKRPQRRLRWQFSQEKRVLIPAIKGDIEEPFISARANLERARLLISTIPDQRDVNVIFNLVRNEKIKAILCVTRSDHMAYLTYRSSVRPVTLVYPVAIQGAVLGRQLWAAYLKMRKIKQLRSTHINKADSAPRIYIIGTSKSNHYLIENFWMSLTGKPEDKTEFIGKSMIHIRQERFDLAPHLIQQPQPNHDQDTPETNRPYILQTHLPIRLGSRRSSQKFDVPVVRIPRYIIHSDYFGVIASLIKKYPPDIILINPKNHEWALRVLMTLIRILERQCGFCTEKGQSQFPLIMTTLLSHSDDEKVTLGDTSRFYKNMIAMYADLLAQDHTYPELSHWERLMEQLLGETIIDAKQEVEESILGIERSLFSGTPKARGLFLKARSEFMELNTCTPNVPGTLARLVAFLSGLKFKPSETKNNQLLPSFQNMRVVATDPLGRTALATGFAVLEPCTPSEQDNEPFFARIYASDGRKYSGLTAEEREEVLNMINQGEEPTVPGFMWHIKEQFHSHFGGNISAARDPLNYNISHTQFRNIMLDEADNRHKTTRSCPGMNTCPIATYQDYIVASNEIHMQDSNAQAKKSDPPIKEAPNYLCCKSFPDGLGEDQHNQEPPAARIMVCFRSERDDPGKLAFALNSLLFRQLEQKETPETPEETSRHCEKKTRLPKTDDTEPTTAQTKNSNHGETQNSQHGWNWVFNIQHLNDQPCINRCFNLNRIFGYWVKQPDHGELPPTIIQLIEILPLGNAEQAVQWYAYAEKLRDFLSQETDLQYEMYCYNDRGKICSAILTENSKAPAAIIIAAPVRIEDVKARHPKFLGDYELCTICGMQGRAFSCEKWRPWPHEKPFTWTERTR